MVGAGEVGRLKTDVGQVVSMASGAAFSVVVTGEWRQRRLYDVGWRMPCHWCWMELGGNEVGVIPKFVSTVDRKVLDVIECEDRRRLRR